MNQLGRLALFVLVTFASVTILDTAQLASAQQLSLNLEKLQSTFSGDQFIRNIAPDTDFDWKLESFSQDIAEAFTFDEVEKAQLKLEHAQIQQEKIDDLDRRGLSIPVELEERRIQKINEASDIIDRKPMQEIYELNKKDDGLRLFSSQLDLLKEMGELNEIRVLYSQLPEVVNADQETKDRFNAKVNSLDTWQKECTGDFNIDELKPLRTAVSKLQNQCPKLLEYEEKFGLDRIKMVVSGTI